MDSRLSRRWRLVLGRFADKNIPQGQLSEVEQLQDQALDMVYSIQLEQRGMKMLKTLKNSNRGSGTLHQTNLKIVNWLDSVEKLFPKRVVDKITNHAVQKFHLNQLLKDKTFLAKVKPSLSLLKQILAIRVELDSDLMFEVRRIIQSVIDDLTIQLKPRFIHKLHGRLNRHQSSPQKVMSNLDWKKTIRYNLKYFDVNKQRLIVQRVFFSANNQQFIPWRVILCIDQSGSMMESVIYSAVIAGILSGLPTVDLKLILFDTSVVDLSDKADNPVEILMSSQMSGGTHITSAWKYCFELTEQPSKTIVVTVSDFYEGGSLTELLIQASEMISAGIKMLGITAMNADAIPFYDSEATTLLRKEGMEITSLSPDHFADWLSRVMEV